MKNNIHDWKEQAAHSIHEAKDQAVDVSRHAAERLDQEARKNPWAFIGVAALISLILGFFAGRKSSR